MGLKLLMHDCGGQAQSQSWGEALLQSGSQLLVAAHGITLLALADDLLGFAPIWGPLFDAMETAFALVATHKITLLVLGDALLALAGAAALDKGLLVPFLLASPFDA